MQKVSVIITTYNRKKEICNCLESVFQSSYGKLEVIVVDNASEDGTSLTLERDYGDKIVLIKNKVNMMAGGGRNIGAKKATGEYLLFIDSDNILDSKMIEKLIEKFSKIKNVGLAGPLMLYFKNKKIIWWAGAKINLWTSKTSYLGKGHINNNQYNKISEVGHVPNCFITRRKIWDLAGGINPEYVMHYEESDFAEKVRKIGFKVVLIPQAKIYHNVPLPGSGEFHLLDSHKRTYYTGRNRVIFMKKHSKKFQFFIFYLFFLPLFTLFYSFKIIKSSKRKFIKYYLKGIKDGLFF